MEYPGAYSSSTGRATKNLIETSSEHITHCSHIGCISSTKISLKGISMTEHALHISDIGCIPSTEISIKGMDIMGHALHSSYI